MNAASAWSAASRTDLLALLTASLVLVWGALPYLPGQIDDSYIVFAYAHNIVNTHEVAWNTGVRVEGYSSPLHLALMTLGALAGADLAVSSKILSLAFAFGLLASLTRSSLGPGRALLAVLIAAWQPFQYWSSSGLETMLATLLGALAWPLVLGRREDWAKGILVLVLLSLARPEGVAWLALALARRATLGREFGTPEKGVLLLLSAFGAYHLARYAYFDHFLPTPYLVKIAAIDGYGEGLGQAARELASAGGILLATILLRSRTSPWVWLPLVVQAALLTRAGGDWMGHARFLVPGLIASVAAAFTHGTPRRWRLHASWLLAPLALYGFAREASQPHLLGKRVVNAGWRDPWFLHHPGGALRTPWAVALLEETSFLIERVPAGAGAAISDVGLPGNLGDIRIWDNAGLTDRVTADVIASESGLIVEELRERYRDENDVWCLRYTRGVSGEETADPWLQELLPVVTSSRSGSPQLVWRCRSGGAPSTELIARRWGDLLQRFPSQDWIRWYYARALFADGRTKEAVAAANEATWLKGESLGWMAFGDHQSSGYQPGRGWALYANGSRASLVAGAPFWEDKHLRVDVDDPGEEGAKLQVRWDPACSSSPTVAVHDVTAIEVPACDLDGERRLVVEFLNDEARDGRDRNVYISLVARGG